MTAPQGQQTGQVTYQPTPPPEYSYEEYLAEVAVILASLAAVVGAVAAPLQIVALTRRDWLGFLAEIYPFVEDARWEIAGLSRKFYDSERAKHLGPVELPDDFSGIIGPDGRPLNVEDSVQFTRKMWPQVNIIRAPYEPDWFEEAMDAVVEDFLKPNATDGSVVNLLSTVVKEAENGGRRTMLWAYDDDPDMIGWARVEGNENIGSCGFCAMMISRGPVYKEAADSGLDLDNASAVEYWRQAEETGDRSEIDALMTRWHPNCDCKVVPVFDRRNWPGKDQYEEMSRLWNKATKGLSNKEALNAFRRAVEKGERDEDNILRFPKAA